MPPKNPKKPGRPALVLSPAARQVLSILRSGKAGEWRFSDVHREMVSARQAAGGMKDLERERKIESVRTARGLKSLVAHRIVTSRAGTAGKVYELRSDTMRQMADPETGRLAPWLRKGSPEWQRKALESYVQGRARGILGLVSASLLQAAWKRGGSKKDVLRYVEFAVDAVIRDDLIDLAVVLQANRPDSEEIIGRYLAPVSRYLYASAWKHPRV